MDGKAKRFEGYATDLTTDKALLSNADEDGSGDVSAGDTLTYRITVTNNGNTELTNVVVNDPLTGTVNAVCGDGSLDDGESCTVQASYVVTQADLDNNGGGDGDIDNTATVSSRELPPLSDSAAQPIVRNTFVAPGLRLPCARTSTPRRRPSFSSMASMAYPPRRLPSRFAWQSRCWDGRSRSPRGGRPRGP